MTDTLDIETSLDRSLRKQVVAPKLGRSFDAAVWARIEAAEQRAPQPQVRANAAGGSRWMLISNVIGVSVAALLAIYFGMQAFTGANVGVNVEVPQIQPATLQEIAAWSVQTITLAALIFGLMFTPIGRRVRSIFT